jgi:hypothetical protein
MVDELVEFSAHDPELADGNKMAGQSGSKKGNYILRYGF